MPVMSTDPGATLSSSSSLLSTAGAGPASSARRWGVPPPTGSGSRVPGDPSLTGLAPGAFFAPQSPPTTAAAGGRAPSGRGVSAGFPANSAEHSPWTSAAWLSSAGGVDKTAGEDAQLSGLAGLGGRGSASDQGSSRRNGGSSGGGSSGVFATAEAEGSSGRGVSFGAASSTLSPFDNGGGGGSSAAGRSAASSAGGAFAAARGGRMEEDDDDEEEENPFA